MKNTTSSTKSKRLKFLWSKITQFNFDPIIDALCNSQSNHSRMFTLFWGCVCGIYLNAPLNASNIDSSHFIEYQKSHTTAKVDKISCEFCGINAKLDIVNTQVNWSTPKIDNIKTQANNLTELFENKTNHIDTLPKPYITRKYDTIVIEPIEDVIVRSLYRSGKKSVTANTIISKEELSIQNLGRDLPILLQNQTNIVTTSDAGNGVGYTGIRVRGSDATRTNVSINGVPINDAESQGVFWVNMPDLTSSANSINIQRGVGSSSHGAGAFGASIQVVTDNIPLKYAQIDASYGAFNTRKLTAKLGSGLLKFGNNWIYTDVRLSNIQSNGYIDRAFSKLGGYHLSTGIINKKWKAKLMIFGGQEQTFQSWWGIPIEKYQLGSYNNNPNSRDTQALFNHYYRNAGSTYLNQSDSSNLFNSNPSKYNYYLYPNETDNYQQHHAHLYFNRNLNNKISVNATAYYTFGSGFFEQFKHNAKADFYGLKPFPINDTSSNIINLVRQRWLQNHLVGINTNVYFAPNKQMDLHWGLGANQYLGQHFGYVTQAGIGSDYNIQPNSFYSYPQEYYRSTGNKTDVNTFIKWDYMPNKQLTLFTDLQYRYVNHTGKGKDNDLRAIDFLGEFHFFNPKAGFTWLKNLNGLPSQLQGSISVGNREPARSDFVDNMQGNIPKPERLIDYELGYQVESSKGYSINLNAYYMDYYNQLVLTGAVNDVGTPLRKNVDKSFRRGIELGTKIPLFKIANQSLILHANASFSTNKIQQTKASWIDYATYEVVDSNFSNVDIAYSPNQVGATGIEYTFMSPKKNGKSQLLKIMYNHKWVGKQYLDNTQDNTRMINAYHFGELTSAYTFQWKQNRAITFRIQVLNVLNNYYANNGYTWGYFYGDRNLVQEVFVFPSAPRNIMAGISLNF